MTDEPKTRGQLIRELLQLRRRLAQFETPEHPSHLALEKLRQEHEKLKVVFEESIRVMALTMEMRDPFTAGHQRRVANLACAIAKQMDFSHGQAGVIRLAGEVHDIGKIHVPAEYLTKPGHLTTEELNIVRTHPEVGYRVLKMIAFPWPIAEIVHQHHERMDGSGYPLGLAGEEIVLGARIVAVADVVEAMASHRPYRPAVGIGQALEEVSQNKGILYDPEVVNACLKVFTDEHFDFHSAVIAKLPHTR